MANKNITTILLEVESAKTLEAQGYPLKGGKYTSYAEYYEDMKKKCLKRMDTIRKNGSYDSITISRLEDRINEVFYLWR